MTSNFRPVLSDLYRVVAALQVNCNAFVPFGARDPGCLKWWLPESMTTLDRFHCSGVNFLVWCVCVSCTVTLRVFPICCMHRRPATCSGRLQKVAP